MEFHPAPLKLGRIHTDCAIAVAGEICGVILPSDSLSTSSLHPGKREGECQTGPVAFLVLLRVWYATLFEPLIPTRHVYLAYYKDTLFPQEPQTQPVAQGELGSSSCSNFLQRASTQCLQSSAAVRASTCGEAEETTLSSDEDTRQIAPPWDLHSAPCSIAYAEEWKVHDRPEPRSCVIAVDSGAARTCSSITEEANESDAERNTYNLKGGLEMVPGEGRDHVARAVGASIEGRRQTVGESCLHYSSHTRSHREQCYRAIVQEPCLFFTPSAGHDFEDIRSTERPRDLTRVSARFSLLLQVRLCRLPCTNASRDACALARLAAGRASTAAVRVNFPLPVADRCLCSPLRIRRARRRKMRISPLTGIVFLHSGFRRAAECGARLVLALASGRPLLGRVADPAVGGGGTGGAKLRAGKSESLPLEDGSSSSAGQASVRTPAAGCARRHPPASRESFRRRSSADECEAAPKWERRLRQGENAPSAQAVPRGSYRRTAAPLGFVVVAAQMDSPPARRSPLGCSVNNSGCAVC